MGGFLQRGRGKKKKSACPHISELCLRSFMCYTVHLSVAVVSAAQRELPVDTPIRSPLSAHTQENKGARGSASRYRSSCRCSALSRVTQETLTLQFPSTPPSRGSDLPSSEAGPSSSLGPQLMQALRPPEVLCTVLLKRFFTKAPEQGENSSVSYVVPPLGPLCTFGFRVACQG